MPDATPATLLTSRVLVLDGAMGTMLQAHSVTEQDARGDRFRSHPSPLRQDLDLLSLTQPELIASIHERYLASGADVITTNSFQATTLSQETYGLGGVAAEIALASARLARRAADAWSSATPERPRLVAGSLGPVPRGPATVDRRRAAEEAYCHQACALLEGGIDILLCETMTSLEQAAWAVRGARDALSQVGLERPILVSFSPTVRDEELARADTLDVWGLGINCVAVDEALVTRLRLLAARAAYVTCHPSAGLPVAGIHGTTPDDLAGFARTCIDEALLNLVGGCCGTTPAHTRALAEIVPRTPRGPT